MGARAPPSTRPRRGGFKCEFCGRFLTSAEGLLSHQQTLHSFALKEQEKRKKTLQPASKVIQKPVLRKTVVSKAAKVYKVVKAPVKITAKKMPETSKTEENLDDESDSEVESEKEVPVTITFKNSDAKNDDKTENVYINEGKTVVADSFAQDKSFTKRRMHFQCPKCVKIFYVYFSAMKHIQKSHCDDGQGEIETMADPDLRPILVEYCFYCDTKYTDSHTCQAAITDVVSYMCTECDEPFRTMKMYDIHISGVHSDALEALFFPIETEFIEWKNEMELQTATNYSKMEKYGNKQVYRCNYTWPKDINNIAFFCPSTIFTQKFPQGLQTHFYTNHSHECKGYIPSDKYKSKIVTELLPQTEGYPDINSDKFDENDLYLQFKKLMETIVVDAAKINIATLKQLVNKAIEMTTVVANYDDDRDFDPTSYNTGTSPTLTYKSTSKDIKTALETIRSSQRLKRKMSADVMSNKKAKVSEPKSPILPKIEKVHSFSLADKDSDKRKLSAEVISNKKAKVSEPKSPILPKIQKVHSFSLADDKDSDKILKELDNDSNKIINNGKSVKWQSPSDEQENLKTTLASPKIQPKPTIGSPTPSFNDTYKDFITTIQKPNTNNTNKTKIKTKIGQFKPSLSPKNKSSLSPKNKPTTSYNYRRHSSGNLKVLKYEVKEREDDCNILILKV